jgi:hypothetical protein
MGGLIAEAAPIASALTKPFVEPGQAQQTLAIATPLVNRRDE